MLEAMLMAGLWAVSVKPNYEGHMVGGIKQVKQIHVRGSGSLGF